MLLAVGSLPAQNHALYFETLDGNQVNARIYNGSDMFWDMESRPRYEVPKGGMDHACFSASLWIGGLDNSGDLHVAANTYRQTGIDFFPGPYRWTGDYTDGSEMETASNPIDVLGLADGRVMLIAGNGFEVFNPVTGDTSNYSFPTFRTYARGMQLQDGRVLIHGDANPPSQLPLYLVDTSSFALTISSTLNNWQGLAQVEELANGEVLFAGVFGSERFDPATGTVTAVSGMNSPRIRGASFLLPNGQVMVAGGSANLSGSNPMSSTEFFDPATNTWTNGPSMAIGRVGGKITDMGNGELLIAGGNILIGLLEHFDIAANSISTGATITPRFSNHVASLLPSGKVAFVCEDNTIENIDMFWYTPGQNAIEEGNMSGAGTVGTVLPNGNFFVNTPVNYSMNLYQEIDAESLAPAGQRWQNIWKVEAADVMQFRQDFQNNTVNLANYPIIGEWPAHGDPAKGEDYYMAPFVDVDLDGVYDPVNDGDYPCIEGDQALWWVYNDQAGDHTNTGGEKMGLQIKSMAYAYDCQSQPCPHTSLDFSSFYHLEIENKSPNEYQDVYVGLWTDTDIGVFSDDYVGSDTARGIGFSFNGTPNDLGGYGMNPPALGVMMLETPGTPKMTNYMYYENDFSVRGNPTAPEHYYNYMKSVWTDGTPLTEGGNGYGGTVQTNYMFSGYGGWCGGPSTGWTEAGEGNQPFDRRMIQSYGPFDLSPGEKVNLDYVIIWSRAFYNDNLGSVCEMQTAADSLQSWYTGQDHFCFNVATEKPEPRIEVAVFDLFPNPTAGNVALELEVAGQTDVQIGIYDQFGRKVAVGILPAGALKTTLQTSDLPNGVYMVQLEGDLPRAQKLVVQH